MRDKWIKATAKAVLPETTRRWIRAQQRRLKAPPAVGKPRIAPLRRLQPIRPAFGFKWGQAIDRYYIENFLDRCSGDVRGHVLEVGDNLYTRRFGGKQVTRSDVLHATPGNPLATIVADLTGAGHIRSESFDCIILTQTLQFIYDVRSALLTLHRVLKPGGVLLVTCHGISQIARYDMDHWGEYRRFTSLSARKLFTEVFSEDGVTVEAHGNVLAATAFLHGLVSKELRGKELDYHDPNYEVLIAVRAVKHGKERL
jgi:SAM-dependent methyltransferase